MSTSANFGETNNCGASVAVGKNCSISVTFTPTAVGNLYGTLTVTDDNNGTPASTQVVPLAGVGQGVPVVSVSASALSFGSQVVNTTSAAQIVTVTNSGTAALNIGPINATGPFAQSNTCGSSVAAGGICTLSVTFTPTTAGSALGSVSLTDNASNSPQVISLTGTGITTPMATLSPASVTFATPQAVGTTSAPQTVTLTNTGSATLIIVGITASANFGETNNCGASVAVGKNCSISVTFTPTAAGNLYGTLTVTDNNNGASASTQVVPLAGVGLGAPAISLSPSTLSFGSQVVNSTSAAQIVTVTNTGSAPLTFTSIVASAGFAATNTCGSPVAPNAICTISVTFTPSASGSAVGSVALKDNAPSSPQAIILSGTGILGPIVTLSDTNLTFGPQNLGTTSPPQDVTLTNTGSAPLEITGITPTGDFAQTDTCPSTLAVRAICTIKVTFTPTAPGNRYGTVTIADNAANSPQTIILGGSGLATPAISLSAGALGFGSQAVDTTSAVQTVTVTNSGTATLTLSSIAVSGPFAQTNTCGSSVAAGGICTLSVTFTPTTPGSAVGSVTLVDNAGNSPQTISLTGTGVTAPIANLSPASVSFATPQPVGSTSAPQTVTLTNIGTATLIIVGSTASANFGETNNCGASVPVGKSCSISVTFTPTAVGNLYGTLTVTDNNNGTPASTQVVPLAGVGLGAPAVSLSASALSFGSQVVNTTSAAQTVTVTNSGTATLTLGSITASGPFAQTNACGSSLAAGATCAISVTFAPTTAGSAVGSVTLVDNAGNSPQTISLTGTGVTAPVASLSPANLTFSTQAVGTTSAPQTVTLTNTGSATLIIAGITASANFGETNNCGSSVPAGGNCSIGVTFTPTAAGNLYGMLTVTDDNNGTPGSAQTVALAGTGLTAPAVTLSASSLTFGSQPTGTTSFAQTLTLTNSGTAALTITSIVITGDFSQTNTCPQSLSAGGACTISVVFSPTVVGTRTGTLTITDTGPTSPQVVSLGGSGSDFGLAVTPPTVSVVAGNSTQLTVTVKSLFGYNAQVTLACSDLPAQATCTASPSTLVPSGFGPVTSTLTISTTQRSSVPPSGQPRPQGPGLPLRPEVWLMSALALSGFWSLVARRNRVRWATVALALLMLLMGLAACGGGGVNYVNPTGTPAGTYNVIVNGSSGSLTHSATVTLTVQ